MKTRLQVFIAFLFLFFNTTQVASAQPPTALATGLTMVSPSACPAGGCAPGQRLTFNVQFNLGTYTTAPESGPNVVVCLYTPTEWNITRLSTDPTGGQTSKPYDPFDSKTGGCETGATPDGYTYQGRAAADLPPGGFGDSLGFAFRLGTAATGNKSVVVRVYAWNDTKWEEQFQDFQSLTLTLVANPAYVANDAGACGANSPCYVNSGGDDPEGIGTGLKDAVDALPDGAKIQILGAYVVKNYSVAVSRPVTIQGVNNSSLTATSNDCNLPLLDLQAAATLKYLKINGSGCADPRDLIAVKTSAPVSIEHTDLEGGANAVKVEDPAADVNLRFNQVSGNTGFAVLVSGGNSRVQVTANNILGNNHGSKQVECNNVSSVALDNNFWGNGVQPADTTSQCSVDNSNRLGAAIVHNPVGPGLDAHEITVTDGKTYTSDDLFAAKHPAGQSDFTIYLANHGTDSSSSPFLNGGAPILNACSNYWAVYFKDGGSLPSSTTLDLTFRYGLNTVCRSTVESTNYCSRSNPGPHVPLWWYDVTAGRWLLTGEGSAPQTTVCDTGSHELQVTLSGSGKPGFPNNPRFIPFVVGVENLDSQINLTAFTAAAGSGSVHLHWQTSSEQNTSGFYLERAVTLINGQYDYHAVPNDSAPQFFPATGSSQAGGVYDFQDSVANGTTYYYRLQVVGLNGKANPAGTAQALPLAPSATPTPTGSATTTFTPTGTRTITLTPTPTGSITVTPTRTKTPVTPTKTRTRTPTPYYYSYSTPIPTRTRTPTGTITVTITLGTGTPGFGQTAVSGTTTPNASDGYPASGDSGTGAPDTPAGSQAPDASPGYAGPVENGTPAPGGAAGTLESGTQTTNGTHTPQAGKTAAPVKPATGAALWQSLGIGGLLATLLVSIAGWLVFVWRGIRS